jgi:prophage regulatory protein
MEFLTIKDLVKILNISKATIYRKISNKQFPAPLKQGKFSYWKRKDIEKWLNSL